MKNKQNIYSVVILIILLLGSALVQSQVLVSNDEDDPEPVNPSAMLEVRANDGGLLIPFVTLDYNGVGVVVAPGISATPADGLIIFHDGSNGITKGLWYYDASVPKWFIYSNWSSEFVIDINNYGELYEEHEIGGGATYPLTNTYHIPWRTASAGLLGPEFVFLNNVSVNTETGTALADQIQVTGPDAVYSINISTTVVSSTAGNEIQGMLFINDVNANNVFFRHTFQNKNFPTNCFTSGLIALNTNDKIDFRFKCTTASEGLIIEHLNIKLTKVGEL